MKKINLYRAFETIDEYWSPRIAGDVNEAQVKITKLKGEFDWHAHSDEDEAFLIVKGAMEIAFRDQTIALEQGDFLVIPKGVEHRPVAEEECWVLLVEPATTLNTGNKETARTKRELDYLS